MRYVLLFLAILLAVPFAMAQKPDETKPGEGLFGMWEYTVQPDNPMATGSFEILQGHNQINGTFYTDGPRKMEEVALTDSSLSFWFAQPEMGHIAISFSLMDGSLVGTATPEGAEEPLPIVAVRPDPDTVEE